MIGFDDIIGKHKTILKAIQEATLAARGQGEEESLAKLR